MKKPGKIDEQPPAPVAMEQAAESTALVAPERGKREKGPQGAMEAVRAEPKEFSAEELRAFEVFLEKDEKRIAPVRDAAKARAQVFDQARADVDRIRQDWSKRNIEKWHACRNQFLKAAKASGSDPRLRKFREQVAALPENEPDKYGTTIESLRREVSLHEYYDIPVISRLFGKRGRLVARMVEAPEIETYEEARENELDPRLEEISVRVEKQIDQVVASMHGIDAEMAAADDWEAARFEKMIGPDERRPPPKEVMDRLQAFQEDVEKLLAGLYDPYALGREKGAEIYSKYEHGEAASKQLQRLMKLIRTIEDRWSGKPKLPPEQQRAEIERIRQALRKHGEEGLKELGE